ncbi:uncharacterized protein [Macrobrachium rosenbergii]|uniref:uncharacterized protein n=1 Tax=Macrobrachium rosenbergii TaxID=79674 RepID=UPI0034D56DC9
MTAKLLSEKFVWHGVQKDTRTWVRQCLQCQISKVGRHTKSGVGEFPQSERRFGHVHIDIVGPLPPSAYNPAANGLVGQFHRSLKASLMASCTTEDWKYQLPWVLLGLRTAPRADGTPSAAEKTYSEPLMVPRELVTEDCHNPSVQRLRNIVGKFAPCKRTYTDRSATFMPPGLSSTTHVFVKDDAVHPPLTRPYRGPF